MHQHAQPGSALLGFVQEDAAHLAGRIAGARAPHAAAQLASQRV
jgi:hypothetical protein